MGHRIRRPDSQKRCLMGLKEFVEPSREASYFWLYTVRKNLSTLLQ